MPLGSWLRSWSTGEPPERCDADMVSDSLIMEMEFQLRELEEARRQKEEDEKRAKGGVDYTWLANAATKGYEMPQLERLDLEQLCSKVKPDECGRVIGIFRDAISLDPVVEEVPRMMRAAVLQVVESRPKEETIPVWLTKSLTSLGKMAVRPRSASRKVTPISHAPGDDLEMQQPSKMSVSTVSMSMSSTASLPNFYVKSEHVHV